jgi:hypothetical protein
MFVFFDRETRKVINVVHLAPINYEEHLEANRDPLYDWVKCEEAMSFEEIEVLEDKTIRRRKSMSLKYPDQPPKIGVEFPIEGIPVGVNVFVNDRLFGPMDEAQMLDFTPQTGGVYKFRFEGSGYLPKEISIEAVA